MEWYTRDPAQHKNFFNPRRKQMSSTFVNNASIFLALTPFPFSHKERPLSLTSFSSCAHSAGPLRLPFPLYHFDSGAIR